MTEHFVGPIQMKVNLDKKSYIKTVQSLNQILITTCNNQFIFQLLFYLNYIKFISKHKHDNKRNFVTKKIKFSFLFYHLNSVRIKNSIYSRMAKLCYFYHFCLIKLNKNVINKLS
jgi:hypothetical protein